MTVVPGQQLPNSWGRLAPTTRDPQLPVILLGLAGFFVFSLVVVALFMLPPRTGESRPYLLGLFLAAIAAAGVGILLRNLRRGFYVSVRGVKFVDPFRTLLLAWPECEFSTDEKGGRRRLALHDLRRNRVWHGGDLYIEPAGARPGELDRLLGYLRECAAGSHGAVSA